jgi:hypothetical protein
MNVHKGRRGGQPPVRGGRRGGPARTGGRGDEAVRRDGDSRKPVPSGNPDASKSPRQVRGKAGVPGTKGHQAQAGGPQAGKRGGKPVVVTQPGQVAGPGSKSAGVGVGQAVAPDRAGPEVAAQGQAAGRQPQAGREAGHAAWRLKGMLRDVEWFFEQTKPNSPDRIKAANACRVLNDCLKHEAALVPLFHAGGNDAQLKAISKGIASALELANRLLEAGSPDIRLGWPVRQLFNSLRGARKLGLLDDPQWTRLATNLMKTLDSDPSVLQDASGGNSEERKRVPTFAPVALCLPMFKRKGMPALASHRKALAHVLGAIAGSRTAEGMDTQAIANCFSLGHLLHGEPPAVDAAEAAEAAHTLLELADESLRDAKERLLWDPRSIDQVRKGIGRMRDGGMDAPLLDQVLAGLDALERGEDPPPSLQPATVMHGGGPAAAQEQAPRALGHEPAQPQEQAAPGDTRASVRATKPAKPGAGKSQTSGPSKSRTDPLAQLRDAPSPKALLMAVNKLTTRPSSPLSQASAADLGQWLEQAATTGWRSSAADDAVRTLAEALRQRMEESPSLEGSELASLLFALSRALATFPDCDAALKPAMRLVCRVLTSTSEAQMKLADVCYAAQGLVPLLLDNDETAQQALEAITSLVSGYGLTLQAEGLQFSRVSGLVGALAPVLGHGAVQGLLKAMTSRFRGDESLHLLSKADRAHAIADIVANAPAATQATAVLVDLLNAMVRQLDVKVNATDVDTTPGRIRLVFSLLRSAWTTKEGDTEVLRVPQDMSDSLEVTFIAGAVEATGRVPLDLREGESDARLMLHMGQGHLMVARELAHGITDDSDESASALEGAVAAAVRGGEWLASSDMDHGMDSAADVLLRLVGRLANLEKDVASQLLAKLPDKIRQVLRTVLQEVEDAFNQGKLRAEGERQVLRTRAKGMMEVLETLITDLPRWTAPAPVPGEQVRQEGDAMGGLALPADAPMLPAHLGGALARLKQCIDDKDAVALQQLAQALPQLPLGEFEFAEFADLVPFLPSILGMPAGRAAVQALAARMRALARELGPPLTPLQAKRLAAEIACAALSDTDARGNDADAVYLLMDALLRDCSQTPDDWRAEWWKGEGLDTAHGRATFVAKLLKDAWKESGEEEYAIPVNASSSLARAFVAGLFGSGNTATVRWVNRAQRHAQLLGYCDAVRVLYKKHTQPAGKVRMVAMGAQLISMCVECERNGIQVHPDVKVTAYGVFLEAIMAGGRPQDVLRTIHPDNRPLLGIAAAHIYKDLHSVSSIYRSHLAKGREESLKAFLEYCAKNVPLLSPTRK